VVVCSWDGQTYIVNLDKDIVRFQFREHVAAFYAGKDIVNILRRHNSTTTILIGVPI